MKMNDCRKRRYRRCSYRCGVKLICLFMVFCIALTACHKKEGTEEPFVVKIGVLLDFTGERETQSEQIYKAVRMAVDEINSAGGVLAEGYGIELICKDDMGDYMNSVAGYYQLVEEGVCAVIGTNNSEGMKQLVTASSNANVPIITPAITDSFVVEAANFTFQSCLSDKYMTKALANYTVAELGIENTALLYEASNARNISLYENFAAAALSEGLGIAYAAELNELSEAALDEAFSRIVTSGAESVFFPAASEEMETMILKAARKSGYKGVFLGIPEYALLTEDTSSYEIYVPCNMASDNDDPQIRSFVDKIGEVSFDGVRPAYDAVYMIRDAIEAGYLAAPASIALKLPFLEGETELGFYVVGAYGDTQKSVDFIRIKDADVTYCGTVFE